MLQQCTKLANYSLHFSSTLAAKEVFMVQVVVQDSKAKILDQFQQILANQQKIESKVATKEEEAEKEKNQRVLEAASQYTTDSIVRGLADLQLEFSSAISGLSIRLTTENSKLDELRLAIKVETQHLQELQQTRVVADALYILTQEHQEQLSRLEQKAASDRETLEKEIATVRKTWQQEQEEQEVLLGESNEMLARERQRQEEDYQYETEQSRKKAVDTYEEIKRHKERELQEILFVKEKQWLEREQILTANQALILEYQRKVDAFPNELEEAVKKAREEGIRDVNQEAKVKADLLDREWQSSKQGYELQIQSLEAKIQKQAEQVTEITNQLQAAMKQAQELAMRAFESSTNRFSSKTEKSE